MFTWVDNTGAIKTFTTGFVYSPAGIILSSPLNTGTQTIRNLNNITWNAATSTMSLSVNNTTASIVGAVQPVKIDVNAPKRWWQYAVDRDSYWASYGFSVNGRFDVFGVTNVSDFIVFWPSYGTTGGVTVDLLGFVAGNAINYAPVFNPPTFTSDGRVIFSHLTTLGTVPAGAINVVNNTTTQMTDPSGYYLVQTGTTSYDMVSAKDAKSWITWLR
jgi:hypothetical protein